MSKRLVLIGNQNSGKTTLFNALTHASLHVGNFPGVTVQQVQGRISELDADLIDLPGVYSLNSYSIEEKVTRDYLLNHHIDCIINVVDSTNLQRNLYLSLQLMELHIPMLIIFNMIDEAKKYNQIQIQKISQTFNIPIIAHHHHMSCQHIIDAIALTLSHPSTFNNDYSPILQSYFQSIRYVIPSNHFQDFYLFQMIEGNNDIYHQLHFNDQVIEFIESKIHQIEKIMHMDRKIIMITLRYHYIDQLIEKYVNYSQMNDKQKQTLRIDAYLLHPYLGIVLFFMIIFFIFYCTFVLLGTFQSHLFELGMEQCMKSMYLLLHSCHVSLVIQSLICDGIIQGVGSVISFLPMIVLLSFFVSLMEDSGYMARIAFLMDPWMRILGLSGQCLVPLLIGYGCSVPAIMASRTLTMHKDRQRMIHLIPMISCGAKIPIYNYIIFVFFKEKAGVVFLFIYGLGLFLMIGLGLMTKGNDETSYLMELPVYRFLSWHSLKKNIILKSKEFIKKVTGIVFLFSVIIWFLEHFTFALQWVEDYQISMLGVLCQKLLFIFKPIGIDDYRLIAALIAGISGKELIVTTLSLLTQTNNKQAIHSAMISMCTPLNALCFLVFASLYCPCMMTIATMKNELNSIKETIFIVVFQTFMAYTLTMMIYMLGSMLK